MRRGIVKVMKPIRYNILAESAVPVGDVPAAAEATPVEKESDRPGILPRNVSLLEINQQREVVEEVNRVVHVSDMQVTATAIEVVT